MTFYFPKMMFCNSLPAAGRRPKEDFALIIVAARTGFSLFLLPQALPVASINWPFRPKKVSELKNTILNFFNYFYL